MVAGVVPRLIFEAFGIYDINANVVGRALPKHQLLAVWQGLSKQRSVRQLGIARGVNAYKMFERGVQQPRTPPRAILKDRAGEIHRKLKEMTLFIEGQQDEEENATALAMETEDSPRPPPIPGINQLNDGDELPQGITMDDVFDREDEAEAADRDMEQWGPWAKPGNYVPVLPPRRPFIPTPQPPQHMEAARNMRFPKRK